MQGQISKHKLLGQVVNILLTRIYTGSQAALCRAFQWTEHTKETNIWENALD